MLNVDIHLGLPQFLVVKPSEHLLVRDTSIALPNFNHQHYKAICLNEVTLQQNDETSSHTPLITINVHDNNEQHFFWVRCFIKIFV